jgi:thioredoxin 1
MAWLKDNIITVFLGILALYMLSQRFGWFAGEIKDDPTSPMRHFNTAGWDKEVLASDKPVLVDFWAPWCAPCRSQGPIVSDLAKELSATALVGKVDVDKEPALAQRYGIHGIPALMVFKDGKVVKSFTGLTLGSTLKKALAEAAR